MQDVAIVAAGHAEVLVPGVPCSAGHIRLVAPEHRQLAHHPGVKHLRASQVSDAVKHVL